MKSEQRPSPTDASVRVGGILRLLRLLTNRLEDFSDRNAAAVIEKEGRKRAAIIGVNGISRACGSVALRLEQPSALTNIHARHTRLLSRAELVRLRPADAIDRTLGSKPDFVPGPHTCNRGR